MKKIMMIVLCFLIVGTIAFAAGDQEKDEAGKQKSGEKIIIKYADFHPLETLNYEAQLKFEEILESKVGDQVDVVLYPGAQLGAQRDLIEQVKVGTIDMTYGNPPYLSNLIPDFGVMDLPYMFSNYEHIEKVMDGEVGDILNEMLIEKEGMRILGWFHIGFRDMITRTKPIRSLADFKGVKFRSPEVDTYVNMFKALGATPTPIPWPEVYQAMKTKIVDGMETSPEGMTSTKVYEVGRYVTITNHINTVEMPIINEQFYQSLPQNVKDAIIETIKELEPWQRKKLIQKNLDCLEELKNQGCEIIEIDTTPLRKACEKVWDGYIKKSTKGQELIDKINALRS